MNRDEITRKTSELSTIAHTTEDSKVEYWYARELMTYMGSCALSRTSFLQHGQVVPEFLRTLVFARPRGDDQFADCTFSPSLDMSR